MSPKYETLMRLMAVLGVGGFGLCALVYPVGTPTRSSGWTTYTESFGLIDGISYDVALVLLFVGIASFMSAGLIAWYVDGDVGDVWWI